MNDVRNNIYRIAQLVALCNEFAVDTPQLQHISALMERVQNDKPPVTPAELYAERQLLARCYAFLLAKAALETEMHAGIDKAVGMLQMMLRISLSMIPDDEPAKPLFAVLISTMPDMVSSTLSDASAPEMPTGLEQELRDLLTSLKGN